MKTNVAIELDDQNRRVLANLIDGKTSQRLCTRKEVCELTQGSIDALCAQPIASYETSVSNTDLLIIDPEDKAILDGKSPSYIIGWNKKKRSSLMQSRGES